MHQCPVRTESALVGRAIDFSREAGQLEAARFLPDSHLPQLGKRGVPGHETEPAAIRAHLDVVSSARTFDQFAMRIRLPQAQRVVPTCGDQHLTLVTVDKANNSALVTFGDANLPPRRRVPKMYRLSARGRKATAIRMPRHGIDCFRMGEVREHRA